VELCAALDHNTSLTELYSSGHKMELRSVEAFAKALASSKSLQNICIGDETFGDEGMAALAKGVCDCTSLCRLDLEYKGLGAAGMKALSVAVRQSQSLTSLSLARNDIQFTGAAALCMHGFGSLKQLDLSSCNIGPEGCVCLAEALGSSSSLEMLRLDGNRLEGPASRGSVAELIGAAALTVRELYLRDTAIGDTGLAAAAEAAMGDSAPLEVLDLTSCAIGPAGGSSLASLLARLPKLKQLILRDNGLGNEGVRALAASLPSGRCLVELDVGSNKIDGGALLALAAMQVQKLGVFANALGDSGARELAAAASDGGFAMVEELDVSGCEVSLVGMRAFLQAVQGGGVAKLKVLLLGANPAVQEEGWEEEVHEVRKARPELDVAWRTNDPGEKPGAQ